MRHVLPQLGIQRPLGLSHVSIELVIKFLSGGQGPNSRSGPSSPTSSVGFPTTGIPRCWKPVASLVLPVLIRPVAYLEVASSPEIAPGLSRLVWVVEVASEPGLDKGRDPRLECTSASSLVATSSAPEVAQAALDAAGVAEVSSVEVQPGFDVGG